MVAIPAGRFLMGTKPDTWWSKSLQPTANERPQHLVEIRSFALGTHEVTQLQWRTFMGNNPSMNVGDLLPVDHVTWEDAQDFVRRLSARTGKSYRLPTEAEWEFAARAGSIEEFSFGNDPSKIDSYAWTMRNSQERSHPVGAKLPNKFGLFDMHGNAWEWVQDCWHENYEGAPRDGGAAAEFPGCLRAFRSGSWASNPPGNRSARRERGEPTLAREWLGLRVARSLP